MIDLGVHNNCICKKYSNTQDECINEFTIREQGKTVKLEPKNDGGWALGFKDHDICI